MLHVYGNKNNDNKNNMTCICSINTQTKKHRINFPAPSWFKAAASAIPVSWFTLQILVWSIFPDCPIIPPGILAGHTDQDSGKY